jgi:cytochrome b6-f complex iron-sulfur subunit
MNRRDFMTFVGVGWVASSLPITIAACASQKNSQGWHTVGTVGDLDQTGQLLVTNSPVGPVLVIGTSKTNVVAVNPTCTHKGCTVEWKGDGKKLQCPCHGSEFESDGKVLKGPAKKSLQTYAAKIDGNSVVVSVS